jgi:hypothetical protein
MFGINLQNQFLDLYPKTSLSFELNNPAYLGEDIDVIQNAFMFTVKVPMTGRNRRKLINPDRVDNAAFFLSNESCGVWCEGIEIFRGLLSVRSATPTDAEISITINTIAALKDLLLTELNHDSVDLTQYQDIIGYLSGSCTSPDLRDFVCFPVWNTDFYGTGDEVLFGTGRYQNLWGQHPTEISKLKVHGKSPVTPFLKVSYLLKKMADSTGFSLNNGWQTNRELQQLCTYNNHSIVKWNADGTAYDFDNTLNFKNHVSKTKSSDYLKNLARLFNLGVYVNFFDRTLDIIPNNQILERAAQGDWTHLVISETTKTETINFPTRFSFSSTPSVLPDMSTLNRYPYDAQLTTDPEGLYINSINHRYYHTPADGQQSQFIAVELENFVQFGISQKNAYTSPLGTLPNCRVFMDNLGVATAPGIKQKGTYKIKDGEESTANFDDKLIFYRGLSDFRLANGQNNPAFATIQPLASSEDVTVTGYRIKTGWDSSIFPQNQIPPQYQPADVQYTLNWNGEKGIYNQWWAAWHEMLQRKRDVKLTLALSTKQVRGFSFQHKIRISNKEYLVKRLRVTLTENGIAPTEVDLVTTI